MTNLSFNPRASVVGGRSVQNYVWTLTPDEDFYILTTTQSIPSGDKLSFGLSGTLSPGGTSGLLTFSPLIQGGSGGEVKVINNSDADKIDYFR